MPENPIQAIFAHLVPNPIGKKNTPSTTEVAHQLSDLPQRVAFVRSAEAISLIHIDDIPLPVEPDDLCERLVLITQRPHNTYYRPKEEVEAARNISNDEPPNNPSRREEKE